MNMRILSPAGDFESLKAAVCAGADEVYLGVKNFNARNIEAFSLETLKQAVDYAHIFGVKINLTVNILFSDEEMQQALDLIVDAYNLGVDSFIIQDVGLMSLVHKNYPQIEIHASTQMGLHNLEGVKALSDLGYSRVVLSRETSLEEIKRIRDNTNVEIEYFCHGALCVAFTGNCYLSSYLNDASGNRGKCKQLCRLPYEFYDNKEKKAEGYLLSAKDFNMLNRLEDLRNAGVDVLKIEGRARRPFYVYTATKSYKQALNNQAVDELQLKLAFNRGFTDGYFSGNGNIISNVQNHIGVEIGRVVGVKHGRKFNEIYLSSKIDIKPKSVLKFLKNGNESVVTAYDVQKIKNNFRITTTNKVEVESKVFLISNIELEEQMLNQTKKREVGVDVFAFENKPIKAVVKIDGKTYEFVGDVCEVAKNMPIAEQDIEFSFLKSEYFEPNLKMELGNIFLTKKQINDFRRNVYSKLVEMLTHCERNAQKINIKATQFEEMQNYQLIENSNEKLVEENILYFPDEFDFVEIESFKIQCEKQNKNFYLFLPNFATKQDVEFLRENVERLRIKIVVNNPYALEFVTEKIIGPGMNVYNSFTANYFNLPFIKAEGGKFKMPYMTLRHCPIKQHLKCDCSNCKFKQGLTYKMNNGKKLQLKRVKIASCTFYLKD